MRSAYSCSHARKRRLFLTNIDFPHLYNFCMFFLSISLSLTLTRTLTLLLTPPSHSHPPSHSSTLFLIHLNVPCSAIVKMTIIRLTLEWYLTMKRREIYKEIHSWGSVELVKDSFFSLCFFGIQKRCNRIWNKRQKRYDTAFHAQVVLKFIVHRVWFVS